MSLMAYFVVIVLIAIMIPAIWFVRKYFREWLDQTEPTKAPGFTLGDLRDLHRQGAMTDAEFEKAKALLVGQAKADVAAAEARRAAEAKKNQPRRDRPDPRYRPPT
jgi:hypothetical protein